VRIAGADHVLGGRLAHSMRVELER
jgi:hypothetical protein